MAQRQARGIPVLSATEWDTPDDDLAADETWDPTRHGLATFDRKRLRTSRFTGHYFASASATTQDLFDSLVPYDNRLPSPQRRESEKAEACLDANGVPLRPHQAHCVRFLFRHRALLAVHSTGTGKSAIAAAVARCVGAKHPRTRIVYTPTSTLAQMRREYVSAGGDADDPRVIFLSHDAFHRMFQHAQGAGGSDPAFDGALLIVDEAHQFKNHDGKRAETLMAFAVRCVTVLLLTATPMPNQATDLAVPLALLNRMPVADARPFTIALTEGEAQGTDDRRRVLAEMFRGKVSFFDRELVGVASASFPTAHTRVQTFEMSEAYLAQYLRLERRALGLPDATTATADEDRQELDRERGDIVHAFGDASLASFYTGLRQATNDDGGEGAAPKVDWVVEQITTRRQQTVVYSSFKRSGIYHVASRLSALLAQHRGKRRVPSPPSYAIIDGDTSADERTRVVREYNAGRINVLLLSRAGGEGLDLKATRLLIMLEPQWNASASAQVSGRAVRFLSHASLPVHERTVDIYTLVLQKPRWWYTLAEAERRVALREIEQQRQLDVLNGVEQQSTSSRKRKRGQTREPESPRDPRLVIRDSIDDYLVELSAGKQTKLDEFMALLRRVSIERDAT